MTAIGGGWRLVHVTDRVIQLRKECPIYRRLVGCDGFVTARGDPHMSRAEILELAINAARADDEKLSQMVAREFMPSKVREYRIRQRNFEHEFGVPGQEPAERLYAP